MKNSCVHWVFLLLQKHFASRSCPAPPACIGRPEALSLRLAPASCTCLSCPTSVRERTQHSAATYNFLVLCKQHSADAPVRSGGAGAVESKQEIPRGPVVSSSSCSAPAVVRPPVRGHSGAVSARAALKLCAAARAAEQVPDPDVLADSILALAKADATMSATPRLPPRQEALRRDAASVDVSTMAEQAVWLEFCGWKASARGYSSAVRLYGRVAVLCAVAAWPPTHAIIDVYVGLFRSAATLARYLSHLRAVLLWLRAPLGPWRIRRGWSGEQRRPVDR